MAAKPKTVADFLAENDKETIIRNRIQAQFAAMLKVSPEEYAYERDFCSAAHINPVNIVDFRVEFRQHVAFVPTTLGKKERYVWFGNPKKVPEKFRYKPAEPVDG